MSGSSITWEIKKRGDETLVLLSGELNEHGDLTPLARLSGEVTFDLAGITRVNSEGARLWINLMRGMPAVTRLAFVRCSIPMVLQMNMIHGFCGQAEVRSFYAPYLCDDTGQEEEKLLVTADLADPFDPPTFPCEGGVLELDDIPDRYFAFLIDEAR